MIVVGDICLATEENFSPYLENTMNCLFQACQITLVPPQNFETDESIYKLRDALIDAFISIIHGVQPLCQYPENLQRLQGYAADILHYIDALFANSKLTPNEEFVKNLYELYNDIIEQYGDSIRTQLRGLNAPKVLRDSLPQFMIYQGMNEIGQRFVNCLGRVGC